MFSSRLKYLIFFLSIMFIPYVSGQRKPNKKKNGKELNTSNLFKENQPHFFLDTILLSLNSKKALGLSYIRRFSMSYNHELTLILFNYSNIPKIKRGLNFFYEAKNHFYPVGGIGYKKRTKNGFLRTSINYRKLENNDAIEQNLFVRRYKELMFKIGYEQEFFAGRIIPTIATDLMIIFSRFDEKYLFNDISYYDYYIRLNGIGLSHSIGVKYLISKNLSFAIESTFNNFFAKEKYKGNYHFPTGSFEEEIFHSFVNKLMFSISHKF